MKGNKSTRTRNWTIVVYPESLPENWIEILNSFNIEYIISPKHDQDKNGAEEEKKEHYHILLMFGGVKAYEQVDELIRPLNCPKPQKVHSAKSLIRYFLHLDHPDKHQYKKEDLVVYGGVDIAEMLRPSSSERYTMLADIMDFIDNNGVTEFSELMDFARKEKREDWFPLLCDSATFMLGMYIKSKRHQMMQQHKRESNEL